MSTTITTPDPEEACVYCGSRIFDHDPVCVRDCDDDCGSALHLCQCIRGTFTANLPSFVTYRFTSCRGDCHGA